MKKVRYFSIIIFVLTIFLTCIPRANAFAISYGQRVSGELTASSIKLTGGQYYNSYTFQGTEGEHVTIDLSSPDFDSFLWLNDGTGINLTFNDDGGQGNDSVISNFTLPYSGSYTVLAATRHANQTGAYTLSLNTYPNITSSTAFSLGDTINNSLAETDDYWGSGEYIDAYTFNTRPFIAIKIKISSLDFPPKLWLLNKQNRVITTGDSYDSDTAEIVFLPLYIGKYTVWVSSKNPSQTGSYTLSLAKTSVSKFSKPLPDNVSGELNSSDYQLNRGQYQDIYSFNGSANQNVNINISADYYSFIRLFNASGELLALNRHAISNHALPASGTYLLWVGSIYPAEPGTYNLTYSISSANTGNITGKVTNACTESGIAGITVTADPFGYYPFGYFTTTDVEGNYSLTNLEPGTYTLTTSSDKYDTVTVNGVVATVNGTATADFAMSTAHNPVLATIADISVTETQAVSFTASATDEDGDTLTYSITGWQCGGGIDGPTFNYTTTCEDSGVYTVTARVDDGACGTDSWVVNINVLDKEKPPEVCTNPYPTDGEIVDFEMVNLTWTGNGDSYDVYLNGELKCSKITDTSCSTGALSSNTIYSWRVDSNNDCGTAEGTNWSFVTGCFGGILNGAEVSTWNTEAVYSVNVENTTNSAETFTFDLHYDPLVMELVPSSEMITEQWGECIQNFNSLDINGIEPGLIRVEGSSGSLPENSSCTIVNLAFRLITGDTDLTCTAITFTDLTGGMTGWLTCPGNICFNDCILGDMNQDNYVDIDDVFCLFKYIMGRPSCLDNVDVVNYSCADVNQDGDIDIDDVFCLFKYIMGRPSCMDGT